MFNFSSNRDNGTLALDGVTFSSWRSEKLAVVGRTGSGKSSLLQAILRLVPLTQGQILLDGVDVAKLNLQALRYHSML